MPAHSSPDAKNSHSTVSKARSKGQTSPDRHGKSVRISETTRSLTSERAFKATFNVTITLCLKKLVEVQAERTSKDDRRSREDSKIGVESRANRSSSSSPNQPARERSPRPTMADKAPKDTGSKIRQPKRKRKKHSLKTPQAKEGPPKPKITRKIPQYAHVEYELVPGNLVKTDIVIIDKIATIFFSPSWHEEIETWQQGSLIWVTYSHQHEVRARSSHVAELLCHSIDVIISRNKKDVAVAALKHHHRPQSISRPSENGLERGRSVSLSAITRSSMRETEMTRLDDSRPLRCRNRSADRALKEPTPQPVYYAPTADVMDRVLEELYTIKHQIRKSYHVRPLPTSHKLCQVGDSISERLEEEKEYPVAEQHAKEVLEMASSPLGKKNRNQSRSSKKEKKTRAKKNKELEVSRCSLDDGFSSPSICARMPPFLAVDEARLSEKRKKKAQKKQSGRNKSKLLKDPMASCVSVQLGRFFIKTRSQTARLMYPSPDLADAFVTISTKAPFLSRTQREALKPMAIEIISASNLPAPPKDLECQPVHCKYTFFDGTSHTTAGKKHKTKVYWMNDFCILLLGSMTPQTLREKILARPLEIEVHDMDKQKLSSETNPEMGLFGNLPDDSMFSDIGYAETVLKKSAASKDDGDPGYQHGVARFDLSELLLGHEYMYVTSEVQDAPMIPLETPQGSRDSWKSTGIRNKNSAILGRYIESGTSLKIKIELSAPLFDPSKPVVIPKHPRGSKPPFGYHLGRIIFILDADHHQENISMIRDTIYEINARALAIDDFNERDSVEALSTYTLSRQQCLDQTLDILTGFHIMDGKCHFIMMEGQHLFGIKNVWEISQRTRGNKIPCLYDSTLTFSKRLYHGLDIDFYPIKLSEPLEQLLRHPLLYVRSVVPRPCFRALMKLNQLTLAKSVKHALRTDLFLTEREVSSLYMEFGVPITGADAVKPRRKVTPHGSRRRRSSPVRYSSRRSSTPSPLTFMRDKLEDLALLRKSLAEDFLDFKEKKPSPKKAKTFVPEVPKPAKFDCNLPPVHNYSTQTNNSTELALDGLRALLSQTPGVQYTFCQDYQKSTLVPINVELLKKKEKAESVERWLTKDGWRYPGMKTTKESNVHPHRPHPARVAELQEKWRENLLNVSICQPTVERELYPWSKRGQDFERYKKPPKLFSDLPRELSHAPHEEGHMEEERAHWKKHICGGTSETTTKTKSRLGSTKRRSVTSEVLSRESRIPPNQQIACCDACRDILTYYRLSLVYEQNG